MSNPSYFFHKLPFHSVITCSIISCLFRSYGFQVPECWDMDGGYRSICYMRPLAIWGMQWALTKPKLLKNEAVAERNEIIDESSSSYLKQHQAFCRVAQVLQIPEEEPPKSFLQSVYDFTCRRFAW